MQIRKISAGKTQAAGRPPSHACAPADCLRTAHASLYGPIFLSDILNWGIMWVINPFQLLSIRRQENIKPRQRPWELRRPSRGRSLVGSRAAPHRDWSTVLPDGKRAFRSDATLPRGPVAGDAVLLGFPHARSAPWQEAGTAGSLPSPAPPPQLSCSSRELPTLVNRSRQWPACWGVRGRLPSPIC